MMSVFRDLSKAFDVIDHKIMFAKLEYYRFRGIVKKLLSDYLSNRIQFVEFENYKSNTRTVQITFIFIDFRVCDFAFAFKTQNAPCVSRFKRVLFSDRFQFAF